MKQLNKAAPQKTAPAAPATAPRRAKLKTRRIYVLVGAARPTRGNLLHAHTLAAMTLLGMYSPRRPIADLGALKALIGDRAIRYHSGERRNLEVSGDTVRLTEVGFGVFQNRTVDDDAFARFLTVLRTGKPDPHLGIRARDVEPVEIPA